MKKWVIGLGIIIIGILIYLIPTFKEWSIERTANSIIEEFNEEYKGEEEETEIVWESEIREVNGEDGVDEEETDSTESETDAEKETEIIYKKKVVRRMKFADLYNEMKEYNDNLVKNGQSLVDAWSYRQTPVNLDVLRREDQAVGYIQIPDMKVTLPLYIGASELNMSLGAAVLSETSMPIGGENTNCVISGHRGYSGAPYFRDIENLKIGSNVYITNPWDTLMYKVVKIDVINPDDVSSILIQEGKDMITLLTCHPYMSHGKYRYVVYCERAKYEAIYKDSRKKGSGDSETESEDVGKKGLSVKENKESDTIDTELEGYDPTGQSEIPSDMLLVESMGSDFSVWFILIEKILRVVIPIVIILGVVIWVVICIVKRKK